MLAWLLNFAYLGLLIVAAPWVAFQAIARGKYRRGWGEKLLGGLPRRAADRPCVWLHAVSVGEVLQLQPLIESLARTRPDVDFVVSTTTSTGHDVACRKFPMCRVVYYPLDFSWAVARALDRVRPTLVVLVELELWPNFLFAARKRHIPVLLVNGRVSERSFRGYRRIRPVVRKMLSTIDRLAVQNEAYASRLIELGAERSRLCVTGSIKFDRVETRRDNPATAALARAFGLAPGARVFVAGSTHAPEERYALDAWLAARRRHPDLRLILVPRHKERFEEVARLVERDYRLPLVRRSRSLQSAIRNPQSAMPPPVLLLDTLGELSACWGLADVAFVGGSLTRRGGQNMIEPAGYGAAVLFGPNTWNFKDVVELLCAHDAARVVADGADLSRRLNELLSSPESAAALGQRASALVSRQRGATERTVELIAASLSATGRRPAPGDARAA